MMFIVYYRLFIVFLFNRVKEKNFFLFIPVHFKLLTAKVVNHKQWRMLFLKMVLWIFSGMFLFLFATLSYIDPYWEIHSLHLTHLKSSVWWAAAAWGTAALRSRPLGHRSTDRRFNLAYTLCYGWLQPLEGVHTNMGKTRRLQRKTGKSAELTSVVPGWIYCTSVERIQAWVGLKENFVKAYFLLFVFPTVAMMFERLFQ